MPKKLWLIRHADSTPARYGGADFERPLSAAGRTECEHIGVRLAASGAHADWLITSDAERAYMTARALAPAFGVSTDRVLLDHRLYLATPATIIDVIHGAPAEVEELAIVGHNPGISDLVALLVDDTLRPHLPTLGIVAVRIRSDWASLEAGAAVFDAYIQPQLV